MFTPRIFYIICFVLLINNPVNAQTETKEQLAIQYYQNEEYEKAYVLFKELFYENLSSTYYYSYFINCLINLNELKTAEKELKKLVKKHPNIPVYQVDMGYIYSLLGNEKKKTSIYEDIIRTDSRCQHIGTAVKQKAKCQRFCSL